MKSDNDMWGVTEAFSFVFYAFIFVLLIEWLGNNFFQMTFGKLMLISIIFVYGIKKFPNFSFNVFKITVISIIIFIGVINW